MKLLRLVGRFLSQRLRCSYLNRGLHSDVNIRHSSHLSAGGREDMAAEEDRPYRFVALCTSAVPAFFHKTKSNHTEPLGYLGSSHTHDCRLVARPFSPCSP